MPVDRTLHHFPLDPFSREVRLVLGEKRLRFTEVVERYWERPEGLAELNPSGLPPVLVLLSDGIYEYHDAQGEQFGEARVEAVVAAGHDRR